MPVNSAFVERLVCVAIVLAFILLVPSPVLPIYYKYMEALLVETLNEENENIIDTNFTNANISLQEPPKGFQPINPIFTTFRARLIRLRSNGFDMIGASPVFTTFRCAWIRFGDKGLLTVSITVEPGGYVWNGRVIGAGSWYVFRVRVFTKFGKVDSVGINIVNETGGLASINCSGDSCDWSGSLVNDVDIISSGSEYIVKANVSIPWNVAGELLVDASATDTLFKANVSKDLKLLVVNETSIDMDSIRVWPETVPPAGRVRVRAGVLYSNTGIPAVGEKVKLYFTPSAGVPASAIRSSNIYETVTDSGGYINVVLVAPEETGDYNIVIEPLHGEPVTVPLVVSEDALGGIAYLLVDNLLILGMIIGISVSALLIILQRKRNYKGRT